MDRETLNEMSIHSGIEHMDSGHYWCLDCINQRTSIVYWNQKHAYFHIFGDKRKYFATHFAKGVLFIGRIWLDPQSLEEANEWYEEIKAKKKPEAKIILLPTRDGKPYRETD